MPVAQARARWAAIPAALLLAASLALFWPGIVAYDSVAQFGQVLSGEYTDWHPPIMARLWAVLHRAVGGGAAPMFAGQMGLYWVGLGLIAAALARTGRPRSAIAVLAIAAWPPLLGWQAVVLKDGQMLAAMLAAVGVVGWRRLQSERVTALAWLCVALLLGYAALVRGNAVFAVAPLAVALAGRRRAIARTGLAAALIIITLAASGPINHGLLDADETTVTRTEALYDLAGIAVQVDDPWTAGLTGRQVEALRERRCVKAFFWDPLGEPSRCDPVMDDLREWPAVRLYGLLAGAALRHPVAYFAHRLAHLNSTDRWLVPAGWGSAAPPVLGEPNAVGLGRPGAGGRAFQVLAGRLIDTPLTWPVCWLTIGIASLIVAARRPPAPARDLALALLASALTLEASFAVLSIASDLRYHLWTLVAVPLALVLLAPSGPEERRTVLIGAAALVAAIAGGVAARLLMPPAPATYQAMLVA